MKSSVRHGFKLRGFHHPCQRPSAVIQRRLGQSDRLQEAKHLIVFQTLLALTHLLQSSLSETGPQTLWCRAPGDRLLRTYQVKDWLLQFPRNLRRAVVEPPLAATLQQVVSQADLLWPTAEMRRTSCLLQMQAIALLCALLTSMDKPSVRRQRSHSCSQAERLSRAQGAARSSPSLTPRTPRRNPVCHAQPRSRIGPHRPPAASHHA